MKTKNYSSNVLWWVGRHLGLILATATIPLFAADPATDFSVEAGVAYGRLDVPTGDADLLGEAVGVQWQLGKLLLADFSLRADYLHLESQDNLAFQRDEIDLDARFGVSLAGFLNPYVGLGVSGGRNQSPAYTPENDWTIGYGVGAGVGFTLIPGLLHTTPAVRYAQFEDLRTITYSLDTALHFTVVGVGLRLNYEDNLSRDGHIASGVIYAAIRF